MTRLTAVFIALLLLMSFARAEEAPAAPPSLRMENDEDLTSGLYDGYFDDAVFVGDSVTRQLHNYVAAERQKDRPALGTARFLAAGNYTLYIASLKNLAGEVHLRYRGNDVTVHEGLKQMGAGKAILLLGLNDHVGSQMEKDVRRYGALIDHIQAVCPGITVICQSMNPVQEHMQSKTLNKANLDGFNERLKALCAEKSAYYLDIATPLMNEMGFLRADYALKKNDDVHLNERGVKVWVDTLRRFAREQYESGLWSPGAKEEAE